MLYISRVIGYNQYGVFDTDDNAESVATMADLVEALQSGVHITGCSEGYGYNHITGGNLTIRPIPFQPVETQSLFQRKMRVLHNIEICVFGEEITRVTWFGEKITEPVSIRLSDFGTILGKFAISHNSYCGNPCVVLVFDDKMRLMQNSLMLHSFYEDTGVRLDLREVKSFGVYNTVYNELVHTLSWEQTDSYIIDSPHRKYVMKEHYK